MSQAVTNGSDLINAIKQAQIDKKNALEKECWFCKQEIPAEKSKWAGVKLTKPAPSSFHRVQRTYETYVNIPRCEKCHSIHQRKTIINTVSMILIFTPLVLAMFGIAYISPIITIIGFAVLVAGSVVYHATFPEHTQKEGYKNKYPAVLELKSQGYRKGWVTEIFRGSGIKLK